MEIHVHQHSRDVRVVRGLIETDVVIEFSMQTDPNNLRKILLTELSKEEYENFQEIWSNDSGSRTFELNSESLVIRTFR